uniref:Uncharacterized protein n=1 Tax=Arundo donax TaxID=35708 RepID=A0A0A9GT43_ARUDO
MRLAGIQFLEETSSIPLLKGYFSSIP